LQASDRVLDVNEAALNYQIIARDFQIKFALQQLGFRHFDFGAALRKVQYGPGQTLPAIERQHCCLEDGTSAEFPLLSWSFYCQVILEFGVLPRNLIAQPCISL
jgi:hypothetical protein